MISSWLVSTVLKTEVFEDEQIDLLDCPSWFYQTYHFRNRRLCFLVQRERGKFQVRVISKIIVLLTVYIRLDVYHGLIFCMNRANEQSKNMCPEF